ncbi:efflux RND transporter periplasmic adaptor subunit [bacterium]|nr:efflux RND transporter periplasmic adaptor subunit [bacterium]MBU1991265.1 efflux RND transporter periplasmic adaptor subunit [bacterium]
MKYLILLFSLLLFAQESKPGVEQLFSVQTVKVKKVTTSKVQKNYGYVKVDESKRYSVTPRFGGFVEVLMADTIYKYVQEGEVLARVYSPEVLSAKEEYLASLRYSKTRANTQMLQSSKEKLLLLNVNENEIKDIERTFKVSQYTNITAPKSGYIFTKNISNLDAFGAKQKLFEIVNLESVWVEAKIHQKEIAGLQTLETFRLKVIGIEKEFEAKKDILYPSLNTKEATLTLRLKVKNEKHLLKEGMYVSINASAGKREYLILPASALMRKNNAFYVFVAGEYEGEYEPREVDVAVLDANTYRVKDGLQEGDEVVSHALFMMDSDAQINGLY